MLSLQSASARSEEHVAELLVLLRDLAGEVEITRLRVDMPPRSELLGDVPVLLDADNQPPQRGSAVLEALDRVGKTPPGVREASDLEHCKKGYFGRHANNIVPLGPQYEF